MVSDEVSATLQAETVGLREQLAQAVQWRCSGLANMR
jgi:hypothetical protein